jgi:hypothetical protein
MYQKRYNIDKLTKLKLNSTCYFAVATKAFKKWQSKMAYPCFPMCCYGFKFEIKLNVLAKAVMDERD